VISCAGGAPEQTADPAPPGSLPSDLGPAPGFVAISSTAPVAASELPGHPAWPDLPSLRIYGHWLRAEIRLIRHPRGRLLVAGHCLATDLRLRETFRSMLDAGEPRELARMPGGYAYVVLWAGELVAAGDLAGQFPLYYSCRGGETLVGLHPGVLAARHGRAPDPITAAAHIGCPNVAPLWAGRSSYRDVPAIDPGAVIRVGRGRPPTVTPAPVPLPEPGMSVAGAAAGVRAAIEKSVADRCAAGAVSADLSGGLDSTSLALLAARHRGEPIPAVVYHNPSAPAGDLPHAVRCAELEPLIELAVVEGTAREFPYALLAFRPPVAGPPGGLRLTSQPSPNALAWPRTALRLRRLAGWGSQAHLTGEGGDALFTAAPSYLADLAAARPGAGIGALLLRECLAQARGHDVSPLSVARRAVRAALGRPSAALAQVAGQLRRPTGQTLDWQRAIAWWPVCGESAGWLTAAVRDRLAEIAADPRTARRVPPGLGAADLAALAELRRAAGAQRYLRELGQRFGVAVHAPLLDTAVVRACLRVPAWRRAGPGKPLLTAALSGLVPGAVFGRRDKGDYSAEEYRGLRAAAPAVRRLLRSSRLADLGVVEPGAVAASFDRLAAGLPAPLGAIGQLLATELWLRDLEPGDPGLGDPGPGGCPSGLLW
jgi:asparagine synthase (glutamine-hydrolysing)